VRGHKGVGLTFLAYGFNHFEVESVLNDDAYRVVLKDSRTWAESDEYDADSRPQAEANHCDPSDLQIDGRRGTRIEIHTDELSNPSVLSRAFNTAEMTKTILETQTAIGVLPPVSENHVPVNVKLDYPSNDESPFDVDDQYRYPHQKINVDLGDGESELETVDIGSIIMTKMLRMRLVESFLKTRTGTTESTIGLMQTTLPDDFKKII